MQFRNSEEVQEKTFIDLTVALLEILPRHKNTDLAYLVKMITDVWIYGVLWLPGFKTFKVGDQIGLKICCALGEGQTPDVVVAAVLALKERT